MKRNQQLLLCEAPNWLGGRLVWPVSMLKSFQIKYIYWVLPFREYIRSFNQIGWKMSKLCTFFTFRLVGWFGWLHCLKFLETLLISRQGHMMYHMYKKKSIAQSVQEIWAFIVWVKKGTTISGHDSGYGGPWKCPDMMTSNVSLLIVFSRQSVFIGP